MKKSSVIILLFICACALFLNLINRNSVPACMNADEAAFGYNAYSLLQTAKDEYGTFMPLRLKSFGDYKMPLYSYLSIPFIALFGLTETATRSLNTLLAFLFPLAIYFLAKELFSKERVALFASFFVATSLGLAVIGRQAHEGYLSALLVTVCCIFYLKWIRTSSLKWFGLLLPSLFFLLLSYQSARIFAAFFLLFAIYKTITKQLPIRHLLLLIAALFFMSLPDVIYKPARVSNLLFFNNPGLAMKTQELRQEGGNRLMYNKATVGAVQFMGQHFAYYSPQFLATRGDENFRFGFSEMPPLTYVEYILFLGGLYFLLRKKHKHTVFLFALLLVTPLAGSLSWAGASITRTLFLLPLIALIASYGADQILTAISHQKRKMVVPIIFAAFLFFTIYSWNFYLYHYPRRNAVIEAQQCGYRELGTILQKEYDNYHTIYISKENGEPYIFTLFYTRYNPAKYQTQASLSAPDKYGFGQVEKYDKYIFTIPPKLPPGSLVVGTPTDFKSHPALAQIDMSRVRILKTGINENLWVYTP